MNEKALRKLNRNRTMPIFDCDYQLFDEALEFYQGLGFSLTYYQKAPYRFASVEKKGIGEFGFYGVKNFQEVGKVGGCYIYVPNIKKVYEELKVNLKAYYGKIPRKGQPRYSRLNQTAEDWRVNITDFSGNSIIIGQVFGDSTKLMTAESTRVKALSSKFEKAYLQGYRFAYSKEDFKAARNTLESAFNRYQQDASQELLFQGRVLQAEVFSALGQKALAQAALEAADTLLLSAPLVEEVGESYQRFLEIQEELAGDFGD